MEKKDKRFEKHKQILLNIIHKKFPTCKVYLFGSRARKEHSRGSDIDIAIDCGKEIPNTTLGEIKDKIEESTIPYFIDVVDICSTSEEMKKQITKDGKLWKS